MDIAAISRPVVYISRNMMLATAMTMALLYLMHLLVYTEYVELEAPSKPIAQIIYLPKVIKTHVDLSKPEPIEDVQPEPDRPDIPEDLETLEFSNHQTAITYRPGNVIGNKGITLAAGGLVQQVMIPPTYPSRALTRGQEGYVDVQFEVAASGKTQNIIVLRSEPEGYFESATIRAVKRWKYLPDEERSTKPAVLQERVSFRLEQ